jgi:hypothetical protein
MVLGTKASICRGEIKNDSAKASGMDYEGISFCVLQAQRMKLS